MALRMITTDTPSYLFLLPHKDIDNHRTKKKASTIRSRKKNSLKIKDTGRFNGADHNPTTVTTEGITRTEL